MSNRNLLILGFVAAVMVALAVVLSGISNQHRQTAGASSYLIQGLDPDQVAKITITGGSEEVILTRRGINFVVTNKDNYPALTSEINKLITTCLDIQTSELYTDNPANFKDLGVTEENARLVVKFFKPGMTLLTGVVIGKQREKGSVGYIRRIEDNKVYIMAAQVPWIKRRPIEYADQQLTNVKREDIEMVTATGPNETYVLKPGRDANIVTLENLPEGRKLNSAVALRVFNALGDLKFDDVNSQASLGSLKFDSKFVCQLKDSTVYAVRLAREANKCYAKFNVQFMDMTPVTKTQGQVESEDQLKKKEAKLIARDAAESFDEKHKNWVFEIPLYQAEDLTKPLNAILEDINKQPASGPSTATDENLKEEIDQLPSPPSTK